MSARSEARAAGAKHYETGLPCRRGHIALRQTSNGNCTECDAAKPRNSASDAAYRAANPERVRQARRRWYESNKPRYAGYVRNRAARLRGAEGTHTPADIGELMQKQSGKCAGCSGCLKTKFHVDHIMPLALGGSNWPANLQLLCPRCNLSKGAKRPDEWLKTA